MAQKKPNFIPEAPIVFLNLLSRQKVPFVIIGGAALALHGIPRATLDIDIVIPTRQDLVFKLLDIGNKAGFSCGQRDIVNLTDRPDLLAGQLMTFRDAAGNELIDVFLEDSKFFDRLLERAVRKKARDFIIAVASLNDLELMKKRSGRPIDLADIALIRERRRHKKF